MRKNTRRAGTGALFAIVAFAALAVSALAEYNAPPPIFHPVGGSPVPGIKGTMAPLPSIAPSSAATMTPVLNINANGHFVGAVPVGTKVPRSKLPPLPMKTILNTVLPKNTMHAEKYRLLGSGVHHYGDRKHPFAATGATIEFYGTSSSGCSSSGTLGALYNVGCTLTWDGVNLDNVSSTDTMQCYYTAANSTTLTSGCTAAVPGASDDGKLPSASSVSTTLSATGTYMFGIYDVTAKQWVAVAYANAGQVYSIKVYQDAFHETEAYQFDASDSAAAYIYLTNVAPADYYVVTVTYSGNHPYCVFESPLGTTTPMPGPTPTSATPASLLCSVSTSTGNQAPGGSLGVTWPLASTDEAGTYVVQVYDVTQGTNLGSVQVSVTGSGGQVLTLAPTSPTNAPPPTPPPAISAATVFDWDGSTDQSDGGFTASATRLTSGHTYIWTMTDPQGQVVATATPAAIATSTASQTFHFNYTAMYNQQAGAYSPGQYPSKTWAVQLYDKTSKAVIASQAFNILGYATETLFVFPATGTTTTSSITITNGSNTAALMKFTNTSNLIYNGQGDSLSQVAFSTGPDFAALTGTGNSGNGVIAIPTSTPAAACLYPLSCDISATDSNGNSWTGYDTCGSVSNNNAECNIIFRPNNSNVTLPVGASLTTTTIDFTNTNGASGCGKACQGITVELPSNGLSWSSSSADISSTPVYFTGQGNTGGTAGFEILGSLNNGTRNPVNATGATPMPFPTPIIGTHFYKDRYLHADYQNETPYTINNSYYSIWAITATNAVGSQPIYELAILVPPLLQFQGAVGIDTTYNNNWSGATCPTGYSAQWVCFSRNSGNIAAGGTETIYFDQTWPLQSFPYTELVVQGIDTAVTPNTIWNLSAVTCPNFGTGSSSCTSVDGNEVGDALTVGALSLNSNYMSTYFSPSTVSIQTPTSLGIVFQNTTTSSDPNPDYIDAVIIQQSTSNTWSVNGTPTLTASNSSTWTNIGNFVNGGTIQYWFGVCAGQYVTNTGPPATTPLTAPANAVPLCTNAQEAGALGPGGTLTINMNLNNFTGTNGMTWTMYAHGANGNGWSAAKTFTLGVSALSGTAAITKINTTSYTSPTVPSIGSPAPQAMTYQIVNNGTGSIGTVVIRVPGTDISGSNATYQGQAWTLTTPLASNITISSNPGSGTCSLDTANTFSANTSGGDGQIVIRNCTGWTNVAANKTLTLAFNITNPEAQSDSYVFNSYIYATASPAPAPSPSGYLTNGATAVGALYLGSDEVTVNLLIGLSVSVDPSNPTAGGAFPSVSCTPAQCAFSGTTMDFGSISNSSSVTGNDVALASVTYEGGTGTTWQLQVSTNANQTCTGCAITKEMQTQVDSTNSGSLTQNGNTGPNKCWDATHTVTYNQTTLAAVPLTGSPLTIATGPEKNCGLPYDILSNYKIQIGTETINGEIATVTYTLVAN